MELLVFRQNVSALGRRKILEEVWSRRDLPVNGRNDGRHESRGAGGARGIGTEAQAEILRVPSLACWLRNLDARGHGC